MALSLLVLILLVAFVLFFDSKIKKECDLLLDKASEVLPENGLDHVEALRKIWEKDRKILEYAINEDQLNRAESDLAAMTAYLSAGDPSLFFNAKAQFISDLEQIRFCGDIRLGKIF